MGVAISLNKPIVIGVSFCALVLGTAFYAAPSALAATPPDSCFAFSAGTINNYYDNENNDPAQPACSRNVDIPSTIGGVAVTTIANSAFASKELTGVSIPNTVTDIGPVAFGQNSITTITIPDSVTNLGPYAFYTNSISSVTLSNSLIAISEYTFDGNLITSITIPSSVTTIGDNAFQNNKLSEVTIPNSVTYISDNAFIHQSPTVPEQYPAGYDHFSYVRLYTEDPSNPNGLHDGVENIDESSWLFDVNGDGDMDDIISQGGHLINPAQATIYYQNEAGDSIQPPTIVTGNSLSSYLASENTDNNLARYYRLGSTHAVTAPATIGSYKLSSPTSPHDITLSTPDSNNQTFIYSGGGGTGPNNPLVPNAPNSGIAPIYTPSTARLVVIGTLVTAVLVLAGRYLYRKYRA